MPALVRNLCMSTFSPSFPSVSCTIDTANCPLYCGKMEDGNERKKQLGHRVVNETLATSLYSKFSQWGLSKRTVLVIHLNQILAARS